MSGIQLNNDSKQQAKFLLDWLIEGKLYNISRWDGAYLTA